MSFTPSSTVMEPYSTTSYVSFSMHTQYVELQARASKSSSSKSSSSSKCTDSQQCQTGTTSNGLTIGLAIGIPVFVFICIIGAFAYRNYRKGKKESESDNDPDFYGETTILPDYPRQNSDFSKPTGFGGNGGDSTSLYSESNPFGGGSARYPTAAMNNSRNASNNFQQRVVSGVNGTGDAYYQGFRLPHQHALGSKQSLDDYARDIGSEYQAYPPSRPDSRPQSPHLSARSSTLNMSQKHTRNLTEKSQTNSFSLEYPTTDSSTSYRENKLNTETTHDTSHLPDDTTQNEEDVFKDPVPGNEHQRTYSDLSFTENEPEFLSNNVDSPLRSEQVEDTEPSVENEVVKEDEDDEDIKRMKSVYKVYFDRENSVKGKKPEAPTTDLPPLPQIPMISAEQEPTDAKLEGESVPQSSTLDPAQNSSSQQQAPPHQHQQFLSTGAQEENGKKSHRAVSSIYSTVPLAQYEQQQQQQQQQRYPQQPQQAYQPYNQPPPQHMYQPPQQQMRYPSQPSSPRFQTQQPQRPLEPLQELPNPNKMDYNSIVTNTEYAPTKSLTGGSRPTDLSVKPFNPLHYSDQIFQPTSPISPPSAQFPAQPMNMLNDAAPPSPHHIRQSIVMVNPVEIGKQKIYRPAGSFQQMNSANSSRAGSLTSQSAYNQAPLEAPGQQEGEYLPRSGSQADLRKQLGSSSNYTFV